MKYKLFTVDCGEWGKFEHLYKDGVLVEQDDSDGWYDIPWKRTLELLEIPFEHIALDESEIPEDFLPKFAHEWDKHL